MVAIAELARGLDDAKRRLARAIRRLAPPPDLTVSSWADRRRFIPRGSASEYGKWDTDRAPYQREMMDAASDPAVEEIVYMTASQVGKTEILNNVSGFYIDHDPAPQLLVAPTVDMAQAWSKDRIAPTIEDTPVLAAKVREAKSRDSDNTILHKRYHGGQLTLVGANAPAGLAQRPIRIVLCDDVDRFPGSAGAEGDPVSLANRRTATFWNRKKIQASTPTEVATSRILKAWNESDQRRFHVACPACGHFQILKWQPDRVSLGHEGKGGIVYEKTKAGKPLPETAAYQCEACRATIQEAEKRDMLRSGKWIPAYPDRKIRGYHISAIYSPWVRWSELVEEWERAHKHREMLKAFINTLLGEPWDEEGDTMDADTLRERREEFAADVPNGVGILVASVDVQDDRLEMLLKGYGAEEESWSIAHYVFSGDPGHAGVWSDLDRVLLGSWKHESGRDVRISCVTIDSGGHHTDDVYRFCAARARRRVFAIKGMGGPRDIVGKASKTEKYKSKLFIVGTDPTKDRIWSRLKIKPPKPGEPAPGYIHIRSTISDEFLNQMVSEMPVAKWQRGRGLRRTWEEVYEKHEGWDLEQYALVALYIMGTGTVKALGARAAALAVVVDDDEPKPTTGRRVRPRRSGGWMRG